MAALKRANSSVCKAIIFPASIVRVVAFAFGGKFSLSRVAMKSRNFWAFSVNRTIKSCLLSRPRLRPDALVVGMSRDSAAVRSSSSRAVFIAARNELSSTAFKMGG